MTDSNRYEEAESIIRSFSSDDGSDDFDLRRIMSEFVQNCQKQNITLRKTGVTLENVTVKGIDSSYVQTSTFANILLLPYTIVQFIKNRKQRNRQRNIIQNVYALAEPGSMVLILGKPGSGCSSLLKTVAGHLDQFVKGSPLGDITFDGIPQREMLKHFQSEIIYNGELDVHFPHLTVKQTLDFAIACRTPSVRVDNISRKEFITETRDLYARIFGLTHTYGTKVGNDFVTGISGGERKRVSIAEALAARGSVYCWDNATRGLDASTALEYTQAIRVMTDLLGSTAFVTLYQASENIYNLFDKVTVLHSGRQIYFGSVQDAKSYFENMGYLCPPRQATPEFLTAITDPNGFHMVKSGFEDKVPRTADEFENFWLHSRELHALQGDIINYKEAVDSDRTKNTFSKSLLAEKSKRSRKKSKYTVSFWAQVNLCTIRGFQRIWGNKSYSIINIVASIVQAFIVGSLYYNLPLSTSGAFSRTGVIYISLLYYCLMGMANISFDQRPILQKQKAYSFYHPAAEALADTISFFPYRMVGLTLLLIIVFFLTNLHRTASNFFIIYLFVSMTAEAIYSLFQMVAACCNTISQANSINGILMLSLSMYSTYMIQLPQMHPWFKWISYVLPMRYAFEAMLNAEFHGRHMDCGDTLVPQGPSYTSVLPDSQVCAFVGSKPGQSWVLGDDYLKDQFQYEYKHTWRNFGIMWCFMLGYVILKSIATEYKRPVKGGGDTLLFKKGHKRVIAHNDQESGSSSSMSEAKMAYYSSSNSNESSSEAFEGLQSTGTFIWRNVDYLIPYEGSHRQLLEKISGYCVPGTLTALMGESGSGKTTLLNTLAQRNIGIIKGEMLVNGRPIDASFERRTGYVQQQDIHIAELSVRESLQFSARLRRPQSIPDAEKLDYVEKVINVLDMESFSEALVGEIGCGLNVEQRKKLSIGVELVAKPDLLLFLDEPTSGLDSQSAWAIVKLLKKLARSGQAILCTIHQPSATLFEEFDRLLLLKKGGQTVYIGDIGSNSGTVVKYFESHGAHTCDKAANPAEYILEVIGAGATTTVKEDWHEVWVSSEEFEASQKKIDDMLTTLQEQPDPSNNGHKRSKYATSYIYQFRYVMARTATIFWRDTVYLIAKCMLFLVAGLYVGFTFFHISDSYVGLQNAMFAAFISVILSAPIMNQIQARAIASRELFEVRESRSNMFHWSLILLTQYLNELPYNILASTLYFVCFYFPVGIHYEASISGVFFLNYCILFQLFFTGLGLLILYMSPNLPSANVIMGLLLSLLVAFCGVIQPPSLMPGFWTFMWKVSPYTYFIQNLVSLMLHNKPVVCRESELNYFNPPSGMTCGQYMEPYLSTQTGYLANPGDNENCAYCLYSVGDEYLTRVETSYGNIWRNFGFYWVYIIFNIFGMSIVYYIFHVKGLNLLQFKFVKKLLKQIKHPKNQT